MREISIDGHSLTFDDIAAVAWRRDVRVKVADRAKEKIFASRRVVDEAVRDGKIVYGLTTGFGEFKNKYISADQTEELQRNLIISHSIGTGPALPESVVRAAALVRANSVASGYSGVRLETIEAILDIINHDLYPFVPSQGSVGASGDLAPLSHLVLTRIGLGEMIVGGKRVPSGPVLAQAGLAPLVLSSKEGLALNNGTSFMTALGVIALLNSRQLAKIADIVAGMTVEACLGSIVPFNARIHALRPHPGQIATGDNILRLCQSSAIVESHKNCDRVQDSYSLRCIPQVHGAVKDAIGYVSGVLEREINSVTDNPLVFPEDGVIYSGGNFHGEPLAIAYDFLAIAIAELANISERRTFKMLSPHLSEGLPAFLIPADKAGLSSGYMIAQYTAAALVNENKTLAHPASVDSIPTSASQEDHVSFGMTAANKLQRIVANVERVLAIELMCAAQALDFKQPLPPGAGSAVARDVIRQHIPFLASDRVLYPDLEAMLPLIPQIIRQVEKQVGPLRLS